MTLYFLDTSALVKRYIKETGSNWIVNLFTPTVKSEIFIAAITQVEIIAAITRRAKGGDISLRDARKIKDEFKKDIKHDYQLIEITNSVIQLGMELAETHGLKGYDAVQLAAACAVNQLCLENSLPSITFVSADNELNIAGLNEGLLIENPNQLRKRGRSKL